MNTESQPIYGWNEIAWKQIERNVFKLQKRIFKAEQRGDIKTVRQLQKLLMKSRSAKLLSIRRVTQDNQGKKTAGVDGVKSLTPEQRLELSQSLSLNQKAKPARRVWIPKPGTDEQRPLGIPVMNDRVLQALVKMALEPEWEAKFEPHSYGFRPGRSTWDAIEAIHTAICTKAKWVLDADIAKCYDRINQTALLEKIKAGPLIRRLIKGWLKSGVVDGGELFPTKEGVPQGSVVSPLLSNIALHGMETVLRTSFKRSGSQGRTSPIVIRYADDLVVVHPDREVIEKCQQILSEWLARMGLELKPGKTRITHTLEAEGDQKPGFDFLGFRIRQFPQGKTKSGRNSKGHMLGFKTIIKPSREAVKRQDEKIKTMIDRHRSAKQLDLIKHLTPVIWGWAKYYSTVSSKRTFSGLDSRVYQKLRAWAHRRHPKQSRAWVYHRYWNKDHGGVAFTLKDASYRLRSHAEMPIKRHVIVDGNRSPYDGDMVYWSTRMGRYPEASTRVAKLLKRQRGKCLWCGLFFKDGDQMEVDHIIPKRQGGRDAYYNWQLIHKHCHDAKTAQDSYGTQ